MQVLPCVNYDDFKTFFFEFLHTILGNHNWICLCIAVMKKKKKTSSTENRNQQELVVSSFVLKTNATETKRKGKKTKGFVIFKDVTEMNLLDQMCIAVFAVQSPTNSLLAYFA